MNFPVLIGGAEAIELTRTLGNKASVLPYTVILNRDGSIAATEMGAVKEGRFESFSLPCSNVSYLRAIAPKAAVRIARRDATQALV